MKRKIVEVEEKEKEVRTAFRAWGCQTNFIPSGASSHDASAGCLGWLGWLTSSTLMECIDSHTDGTGACAWWEGSVSSSICESGTASERMTAAPNAP